MQTRRRTGAHSSASGEARRRCCKRADRRRFPGAVTATILIFIRAQASGLSVPVLCSCSAGELMVCARATRATGACSAASAWQALFEPRLRQPQQVPIHPSSWSRTHTHTHHLLRAQVASEGEDAVAGVGAAAPAGAVHAARHRPLPHRRAASGPAMPALQRGRTVAAAAGSGGHASSCARRTGRDASGSSAGHAFGSAAGHEHAAAASGTPEHRAGAEGPLGSARCFQRRHDLPASRQATSSASAASLGGLRGLPARCPCPAFGPAVHGTGGLDCLRAGDTGDAPPCDAPLQRIPSRRRLPRRCTSSWRQCWSGAPGCPPMPPSPS